MSATGRHEFDVLTFPDFVALDDITLIDLVAGVLIHLAVADPVASLLIELVKVNFLALRSRGIRCDRARNQRQPKVTLQYARGAMGLSLRPASVPAAANFAMPRRLKCVLMELPPWSLHVLIVA
jgi:hypothetical protein